MRLKTKTTSTKGLNNMCEECHQNPCARGCPNEPMEVPVMNCSSCKADLFVGDIYYPILEVCEYCLEEYEEEIEEPTFDDEEWDEEDGGE